MNIMYRQNGDYLYPFLELSQEDNTTLKKYGRMRLRYLQEYRPGLYTRLLLSGKLYADLKETQEAAQARMGKIEADMAKEQGVSEALKARDQIAWVGVMNMIRLQAEEMVLQELIYC